MRYDIAIIGAGLSGLTCAYILAKEGKKVLVLEKNPHIGGSIQNFERDGVIFDTGAHYFGGLNPGESLFQYFKYFDLFKNIKYQRLDISAYDIVKNQKSEYHFAQGYNNFIETLLRNFPKERDVLKKYTADIKAFSESFSFYSGDSIKMIDEKIDLSKNAFHYLKELTHNIELQNVLTANNILYLGKSEKTPLYLFSLINYSYLESAWRIKNGSGQIAENLANSIRNFGGEIITSAEVEKISVPLNQAEFIELKDSRKFAVNQIISTVHPVIFTKFIDSKLLKKSYRNRIFQLENTSGVFSLYIIFKEKLFKHTNSNFYCSLDKESGLHNILNINTFGTYFYFFTSPDSENQNYAKSASLLVSMNFSELEKWENTHVQKRGTEYLEFKQHKANYYIDKVEEYFPGFTESIQKYYTSTPLTYRDYTGTFQGSTYGILKDTTEPLGATIFPYTKIPNIFLAGQSINIHGVHGVIAGSVMTCSQILGREYLATQIKNA